MQNYQIAVIAGSSLLIMVASWLLVIYMTRRNQEHLLKVLDRFLSRHFEEYAMTDMIKKEIEVDQNQETEEVSEDEAIVKWLEDQKKAAELVKAGEKKRDS